MNESLGAFQVSTALLTIIGEFSSFVFDLRPPIGRANLIFSHDKVGMWCQIWQRPSIHQELREYGRTNTQFGIG